MSAATENHFDSSCGPAATVDYVFAWSAPNNSCVTIDTSVGELDTILSIWDACPIDGGQEVTGNDEAATIPTSKVTFFAESGTKYYIGLEA